jgi:hypothetical protein
VHGISQGNGGSHFLEYSGAKAIQGHWQDVPAGALHASRREEHLPSPERSVSLAYSALSLCTTVFPSCFVVQTRTPSNLGPCSHSREAQAKAGLTRARLLPQQRLCVHPLMSPR